MTLRFLQQTASSRPEFPFQAGQLIHVSRLTAEMRGWVKDGAAEVVAEEPERAVLVPTERATTQGSKGHG